ncbi:glycosyltransferase [Georgenia faecalis]|uniref:glycosyltransferase n=1 Tax=Georgenia faecalis TaxID=2483799 RepID=UPI000FD8D8B1|nr:glycosyltransferase [Georgenia faecalis]
MTSGVLPPPGLTLVAGFESTYVPGAGLDAFDLTLHTATWREDLDAVLTAGVRHLRYPLLWHRIESEPGVYDWREADAVLGHLRDRGAVPIVDLVHHTSYPDWLTDGFRGGDFGPAFVRYAEAVATRYPWLPAYTLFNEPFATLFLAGHEGLWPPYDKGDAGFARLLGSVLPALSRAAALWRELLPDAQHVWIDTAEHHTGVGPGADYAAVANDRRHIALDLALGHDLRLDRPYLRQLVEAGGEGLLTLEPLRVDVLGLDYYSHSEWFYDAEGGHAPSPGPVGLAEVIAQYGDRYGLPMMVSETNVRGLPSDRVSWLRYVMEQYEVALERGYPLHGLCWFPQVSSCDWDTLLALSRGRADPVGVVDLADDGTRTRTIFTEAWEAVASGATAADLPAYRFQSPCDEQLVGIAPATAHWPWRDPPPAEVVPPVRVDAPAAPPVAYAHLKEVPKTMASPDLVVISHLRWVWVWQRPQHLVSRLARARAAAGARTFFVEEPAPADVDRPTVRTEEVDGITRVWLEVPRTDDDAVHPSFDDPRARDYGRLLAPVLGYDGPDGAPDVWLYTPMGVDIARSVPGGRVVYDVMDDLASFRNAPRGLMLRQRNLLAKADVVFTGGRSLHRSVLDHRREGVHLFPSGVESDHYAGARALRGARERKVAGYVGVIDERLDLGLIADLAAQLPDWTLRIVGPVAKIDEADVPTAPNIEYLGLVRYNDLPEVMAGFDVALMPFALNEATRSISPTKTLEYLAAGLPVVSTRVPDVVADYATVVHLADDGAAFARACREVVEHDRTDRDALLEPLLALQEWDRIACAMAEHIEAAGGSTGRTKPAGEATG